MQSPMSLCICLQFGWCVMWSLLQRGESIYTEMSPLDMDVSDQKQWYVRSSMESRALKVLT